MPQQIRNIEHNLLHTADLAQNRYSQWHEPFGDFGVWNGQFEVVSSGGVPEGWQVTLYAGGMVDRVTSGLAGQYRMRGGQAGVGAGGVLRSNRFFMVDEAKTYYVAGAFITNGAAPTVYLGCECYDANQVSLGYAYAVSAATPGAVWTRYFRRIGPAGDVAWQAGTRYARVIVILQGNAALGNAWAYCDDIQFQQLKAPLVFDKGRADDGNTRTFTLAAYTVWTGSSVTVTLTKQSYLSYSFMFSIFPDTVRAVSWIARVYIDGVADSQYLIGGCDVASSRTEVSTGLVLSNVSYAAGNHTVDLRVSVQNVGDTVTGRYISGTVIALD